MTYWIEEVKGKIGLVAVLKHFWYYIHDLVASFFYRDILRVYKLLVSLSTYESLSKTLNQYYYERIQVLIFRH